MKWTDAQDHALVSTFACSTTIDEAMRKLSACLGFDVTKDSAEKRLRRVAGKGLTMALGGALESDRPLDIPPAPYTLPGGFGAALDVDDDPPTLRPRNALVQLPKLSHAGDYQRVLILPDTHVPYHDRQAWALMLRAAHVLQPDIIIHLGDLADFYSVSFHSKDPGRKNLLIDERDEVRRVLDTLEPFRARKIITKGNHEHRLERYITDKAPELFGLVDTDEILGFGERDWEVVPYRKSIKIGHVSFTHEEGNAGALAHIKAGATFEGSAVIGHTHAMGMQFWRNAHGVAHVSASFGWLGSFDAVDYVHRAKALRWQLGFGIGLLEPGGNLLLEPCPIVDGRVSILGRMVS